MRFIQSMKQHVNLVVIYQPKPNLRKLKIVVDGLGQDVVTKLQALMVILLFFLLRVIYQ